MINATAMHTCFHAPSWTNNETLTYDGACPRTSYHHRHCHQSGHDVYVWLDDDDSQAGLNLKQLPPWFETPSPGTSESDFQLLEHLSTTTKSWNRGVGPAILCAFSARNSQARPTRWNPNLVQGVLQHLSPTIESPRALEWVDQYRSTSAKSFPQLMPLLTLSWHLNSGTNFKVGGKHGSKQTAHSWIFAETCWKVCFYQLKGRKKHLIDPSGVMCVYKYIDTNGFPLKQLLKPSHNYDFPEYGVGKLKRQLIMPRIEVLEEAWSELVLHNLLSPDLIVQSYICLHACLINIVWCSVWPATFTGRLSGFSSHKGFIGLCASKIN